MCVWGGGGGGGGGGGAGAGSWIQMTGAQQYCQKYQLPIFVRTSKNSYKVRI